MGPREEAGHFPWAREAKGRKRGPEEGKVAEGKSTWGSDGTRREGHLPETDSDGRPQGGCGWERWKARLDPAGERQEEGVAGRNPGRSQRCQGEGRSSCVWGPASGGRGLGKEEWGGGAGSGWGAVAAPTALDVVARVELCGPGSLTRVQWGQDGSREGMGWGPDWGQG